MICARARKLLLLRLGAALIHRHLARRAVLVPAGPRAVECAASERALRLLLPILVVGLHSHPLLLVPGHARAVLAVLRVLAPLAHARRRRLPVELGAGRARQLAGRGGELERERPEDRERATHGPGHVDRDDREPQARRVRPMGYVGSGVRGEHVRPIAGGVHGGAWLVLAALALGAAAPAASAGERFDTVVIDAGHGGSDV